MNNYILCLIALLIVHGINAQTPKTKSEVSLIDSFIKVTSSDSLYHTKCYDLFAVESPKNKIGSSCTKYFSVIKSKDWRTIVNRRQYSQNEYISIFYYRAGNLIKAQLSQIKHDSLIYSYSYYINKNSIFYQEGKDYPLAENGIDIFKESKRLQKQFKKN